MLKIRFRLKRTYTGLIALSFLGVILTGALLLCLPVSSRTHDWTAFVDALFTATTSTCVTGLVVFDTYTYWSVFGQIVILCLIQIGGLGLMTLVSMFFIFMRRRVSMHERRLLMQSAGSNQLNGVMTMVKHILIGTAVLEGTGTVLLAIRFCPQFGFWRGLYNALFHAVSAFCNAGIDLMGKLGPYSSLTSYRNDPLVCVTVMCLIVIGGIGFIAWEDIARHKFHISNYALHTKIVLTVTAVLIFGGAALFYGFENHHAFADLTPGEKVLAAFFQSITPRTAGFNTVDQTTLSNSGSVLTMVLMFIGGSPGSTAGGIKTTTILIILMNAFSFSRSGGKVVLFKKRIDDDTIKQASSIMTIYLSAIMIAVAAIMALEPVQFRDVFFEVISAIGTVGLTMGITPSLCTASELILICLMYLGRIGGLSLMFIFAENRQSAELERPVEKIMVG